MNCTGGYGVLEGDGGSAWGKLVKHLRFAALLLVLLLAVPGAAVSGKGKPFPDVKKGAWYYSSVTEMADKGLLLGYEDGTFRPEKSISFAEFTAVVSRCVSLQPEERRGHWASGVLQAALQAGWYDWDECPPDDPASWDRAIPRQVAVKVMMKAFAPEARGDYNSWAGRIGDFNRLNGRYYEPVLAAYQYGVLLGDEKGNFCPEKGLTRAEGCALISRALAAFPTKGPEPVEPAPPPAQVSGGVSESGWLKVKGTQLCSQDGAPVMLRGISSHGIQWYPQFASRDSLKAAASYGANVFRIAMYTEENGYLSNPAEMKRRVIEAVDAAVSLDLYVVIDWHILSDGNPNTHVEEAVGFFEELSLRYQDTPNVLYEICNEPNGGVTWEEIARYAGEVIPAIRKNSPRAVILCGCPTWSQDVDKAAKAPLPFDNVMITLHFYAGTHGESLRNKLDAALQEGLPVFVSEWGVSDAAGSGGVFLSQAEDWLEFLEARGVSWINWSLCCKEESSAALRPEAGSGNWTDRELSESGRFVFSKMRGAQ